MSEWRAEITRRGRFRYQARITGDMTELVTPLYAMTLKRIRRKADHWLAKMKQEENVIEERRL